MNCPCQALADADGAADHGADHEPDDRDGGSGEDDGEHHSEGEESEESQESWDGTTLVLVTQSPPPSLPDPQDGDSDSEGDMASTDNESRSPWEVTGESAKWKALKKQRASEGKPWPPTPSDTEVPGHESEGEEEEYMSDGDEDVLPNLPSGSSGAIDDHRHLLEYAVPPMPDSPSLDDDEVDEHYVTPPKRASGKVLKSAAKTTCPVNKVKKDIVKETKVKNEIKLKSEPEAKVKQEFVTAQVKKEPMDVSEDTWLKGISKDGVGQGWCEKDVVSVELNG